jgi:predicted TIM-barrel fold metal-dependent hydrolase
MYNPIWVDEIAGIFPDVPIVLIKMGRGFRSSFDTCMVVAMRNANVYFDMTESPPEHVREALARIGPSRIMFGTDLSAISVNYAYEHGFAFLNGTEPDAEELDWMAWRTANDVYRLGLA